MSSEKGGSRLQKLLNLIDNGSNPDTRKVAAQQIAAIVAAHPEQIASVIHQVSRHLRHKDWDARVAAGHCLGKIATHVDHHTPQSLARAAGIPYNPTAYEHTNDITVKNENLMSDVPSNSHPLLSFDTFQVTTVLEQGTPLVASAGNEFDIDASNTLNRADTLSQQRENLKKRMGLGGAAEQFINTADFFSDEDFVLSTKSTVKKEESVDQNKKGAVELLADMSGMSARERAAAARKAKAAKKRGPIGEPDETDGDMLGDKGGNTVLNQSKRAKTSDHKGNDIDYDMVQSQWQSIQSGCWPFQELCDQLCVDLLHPKWEVRHGAAIGLREILSSQSPSAGVVAPLMEPPGGWMAAGGSGKPLVNANATTEIDVCSAWRANARWIEDCAIHMLSTLALDRFGDYVSDQVVAPVRETVAQALGMVSRHVTQHILISLVTALRSLAQCSHWEARHGGLQGLKYVLAAQKSLDVDLVSIALPASISGLQDKDDDVRAVAAEALLPAAQILANNGDNDSRNDTSIKSISSDTISQFVSLVWDVLLIVDELSPAVKGASALLASVYSYSIPVHNLDLSVLLPRLWPHLRHNLSSVRISALKCFTAIIQSQPVPSVLPGPALATACRLIFQNILQEKNEDVLEHTIVAWNALIGRADASMLAATLNTHNLAEIFLSLASTPVHKKYDAKKLLKVDVHDDLLGCSDEDAGLSATINATSPGGDGDDKFERATRMRMIAARAVGFVGHILCQVTNVSSHAPDGPQISTDTPINPIVTPLISICLRSTSASARILGGMTIAAWARCDTASNHSIDALAEEATQTLQKISASQSAPRAFDELAASYTQLQRQTQSLIQTLKTLIVDNNSLDRINSLGIVLPTCTDQQPVTPASALHLIQSLQSPTVQGFITPTNEARNKFSIALSSLQSSASALDTKENILKTSVLASLAAAIVFSSKLPDKLNSLIQPLIASVRREPDPLLQEAAAKTLARLTIACTTRVPSPVEKIVKNVCSFACGDPDAVPDVDNPPSLGEKEVQKLQGTQNSDNRNTSASRGPRSKAMQTVVDDSSRPSSDLAKAAALARRGGEIMLCALTRDCGIDLPAKIPSLYNKNIITAISGIAQNPRGVVEQLRILQVIAPHLHPSLASTSLVGTLIPSIITTCLTQSNGAIQLSAARTLASIASVHTESTMPPILDALAPLLSPTSPDASRLGAIVTMRELVNEMGNKMIPFVQLAVVPLLGRMSDPNPPTRAIASSCFASVIALMPLAQGVPPPPGLTPQQHALLEEKGKFLLQLLDNKQMEDFKLPFTLLTGTLRPYQQEGINWLAFLRRFGLHGVLADDMGLGKTLQATSIVAAATFEAKLKFQSTGAVQDRPRPSLIVCPATLVAHWPHEIAKFVPESLLKPLQYHGSSAARTTLRPLLASHDIVVMSYEAVRADIDWISGIKWMYCILDEGHVVRNPSSMVAKAVRRIEAEHRLILSGTPIQNSVVEMWALFDFLMPGFLGSEKSFNSRYGRALSVSRRANKGSKEAEAGILALDSLHRQVMPFVLRRTKDQVLKDLPPKIVQDIICDPSDLQRVLYDDFAQSQAMAAVVGVMATQSSSTSTTTDTPPHVFQALHYLRKLCSHPLLVIDPLHVPAHQKALAKVLDPKLQESVLAVNDWHHIQEQLRRDLSHSPKLAALKELLIDCGIGTDASTKAIEPEEEDGLVADSGHRALIFAQTRAFLDLVESAVLRPMGIDSLRIDGSVNATERFRRVQQFNADPTIEVMLLTTAVGGLGLNLTAADTVMFLEHDWNPQKDLQAMDRAHRLGQKRTVNVYRLLVRGTLEEQVMSLQKFKLDVAAAVVNAENMSFDAMDTGNLLDLFAIKEDGGKDKTPGTVGNEEGETVAVGGKKSGLAAVLANLTDPAQAEAQYGEEFDLEAFKNKL